MELLSQIVTDSGWIYSLGTFYSGENGVFRRPLYYPDPNGERMFRGMRYKKYRRLVKNDSLPVQPYSMSMQIDPWSVLIPRDNIVEITDTRHAFAQWMLGSDSRIAIITEILDISGIKISQCGLGGSAGIGCETTNSDVDIIVFGVPSVFACKHAIESVLLDNKITLMTQDIVSSYAERYSQIYGINQHYLHAVFAGDLTKVYYSGKKISFIFVYDENERDKIPSGLYSKKVYSAPEICINARIIDGSASWLYPRKYLVEKQSGEVFSVWSHHWLRDLVTKKDTLVKIIGRDLGGGIISLTDLKHQIIPFVYQ